MKQVIKQFRTYLMLAILFVSSSGFTLFSHFCFMEGDRSVSTSKIESCCDLEEEQTGAELKSNCCQEQTNLIKLGYFTSGQRVVNDDQAMVYFEPLMLFEANNTKPQTTEVVRALPPPKSGRTILTDIHILRI
jgi:hypothetical protein